ncbi:MAG: AAA family ATPase [Chloroflexota bacterium]
MKVLGVIGRNGSGKDEVVKYLKKKYDVPFVSVGDMVRGIARQRGISPTRENLHQISREQMEKFGKEHFMSLAVERIEQNGWETAGLTGVRTPEDVRYLKHQFDSDFILFHVYVSDSHLRYKRTQKRAKPRDPQSYDEFLEQDRTEETLFGTSEAIKQADYSLNNDKSIKHLHDKIDRILQERKLLIEKEEVK